MAEFSTTPTLFSSMAVLVAALADLGLNRVEMFERAMPLRDEHGNLHSQTAELIVRRECNAGANLDLGFKLGQNGLFLLVVSEQDQATYDRQWLQKLNQRYNYHLVIRRLQDEGYGLADHDQASDHFQPHGFLSNLLHLIAPNLADRRTIEELARNPHSLLASNTLAEVVAQFRHQPSRQKALQALAELTDQSYINQVCKVWVVTRNPDLGALLVRKGWVATTPTLLKVLTALKTERVEQLANLNSKDVSILLEACTDPDVAEGAHAYLRELQTPSLLDGLCETWAAQRDPFLLELIQSNQYMPRRPTTSRVLILLKLGRWETLTTGKAAVVAPLIEACADNDPAIVAAAQQALGQLKKAEAQQALCELVIKQDLGVVEQIAVAAGYLPAEAYRRALFFFVTEQWERYEALDFDHTLLRAAYETANPRLRRRLTEKIRIAGRIDYLKAITGSIGWQNSIAGQNHIAGQSSPEEIELVVQLLADNREWERLWPLVFELTLEWGNRIVNLLAKANWQPVQADERAVLEQLKPLAVERLKYSDQEISNTLLPLAVLRARAKVSGRINTLAFSPNRPVIAIGTGAGRVVLWNWQKAEREQVLSGFEHSVGRVTFTRDAKLVCAERTSSASEPCSLYTWTGNQLVRLGEHIGSITNLEAVGENQVLSTGRDHKATLWDLSADGAASPDGAASNRTSPDGAASHKFSNWARAACVSANGERVALLHGRGVTFASLPELQVISQVSTGLLGVARSAVFAPDEEALLVGKYTGGLGLCQRKGLNWLAMGALPGSLSEITGYVQGLATVPSRNLSLAATTDGLIRFIDWANDSQLLGRVEAPGERLTSLTVSPDGAFMAVGDSDASFTLWDLRVLELNRLFDQPLSQARPVQLAALTAVLESGVELPTSLKLILRFAEITLRHRFRYAIELADELPLIQAGEFDIEIE
jgi:WD40 repeat protein